MFVYTIQPVVRRLSNRFDNRLYRVNRVLYSVYTIQPVVIPVVQTAVVQPVVKPVWEPAVSCKQTSNRVWQPVERTATVRSTGCQTRLLFDNRVERTVAVPSTRLSNRVVQPVWQPAVYTIQPVVKPAVKRVWQPVWQQVVSCRLNGVLELSSKILRRVLVRHINPLVGVWCILTLWPWPWPLT